MHITCCRSAAVVVVLCFFENDVKIEKIVKRRRGGNIIQLYSFKSCETAAGSQSSASVEWKTLVVDVGKCEVKLKTYAI